MLYQFWVPFVVLTIAVLICEGRWCMLRDQTKADKQPYSWSRVQLAWWTIIILSSFIAIIWYGKDGDIPKLHESIVILLGISAVTITTAQMIDLPENNLPRPVYESEGFFFDILSDSTGISIARFQTIIFNFVFGVWFTGKVLYNLPLSTTDANAVMPIIDYSNLALLGISSITYAALKSTDKKAAALEVKEEQTQLAEDGSVG